MRLTKIEFNGYKRLLDTTCNVDSKVIAFIGPNESGKSSVLEAFEWLTDGTNKPLIKAFLNRSKNPSENDIIVAALCEPD